MIVEIVTRDVPVSIPVSENAADIAENAGMGIGEYASLSPISYHVIYYLLWTAASYFPLSLVSPDWHYISEINFSMLL